MLIHGLMAVLCAFPALAPANRNQALTVTGIRHSTADGRTRVVLDVSGRTGFTVNADSGVVSVTVPGARLAAESPGVSGGLLTGIQTRAGADRVDVLLQTNRQVTWKEFSLPQDGKHPFRIVIDLMPAPDGAPESVPVETASEPGAAFEAPPAAAEPRSSSPRVARPFVVAIDAGHGGHDSGTLGKYGLVEKKLCLDIARRVVTILDRQPGVDAVLTRNDDVFLTLPRRNQIAEEKKADIFVSIHMNSAPSSSARGAEIFFVAPAGAEHAASKALATGEAAHDFGLDPGDQSDIVHMLLDVNQQTVLARSELLASFILDSVRGSKLLPTRAVKQKSFSVLRTISMPSVLVECGFISNTADAKLIRDPAGREKIARAVSDGVLEFFSKHPPHTGDDTQVAAATVHRVQAGDTLWTISRRYQTTVDRLRQLNNLSSRANLRVGQELLVRAR